jgi:hypothetical protein
MKLYIQPCELYPLHELDITDWLAKEKGFDSQLTEEIEIISEKPDAYCIGAKTENLSGEYWLPRSQCKIVERTGPKK